MKKILSLFFGVLILVSCGDSWKSKTFKVEDEVITHVRAEDEEMNAAIKKAKDTFNEFKQTFLESSKTDKYHSFTIKIGFDSPMYGKEHMWLGDLRFENDKLVGALFNKPVDPDVQYNAGDTIVVNPDQVSDWMYIEKSTGITYGGYTFRVMRNYLSDEEKKEFDEQTGLKFE